MAGSTYIHDDDYYIRGVSEEEDYYRYTATAFSGRQRQKRPNNPNRKSFSRILSNTITTNATTTSSRAKRKSRNSQYRHRHVERRRKIDRLELQQEQLESRKANTERKIGDRRRIAILHRESEGDCEAMSGDEMLPTPDDILTGSELGIEDEDMYDRLMDILEGGEITPEDYDLLLLLDQNNTRATLTNESISHMDVFQIGDSNESEPNQMSREEIANTYTGTLCEICLQPWQEMPNGTEIRCLPCNHIFCKTCIDHWLTEASNKCPTLSCYWEKTAATSTATNTTTTTTTTATP